MAVKKLFWGEWEESAGRSLIGLIGLIADVVSFEHGYARDSEDEHGDRDGADDPKPSHRRG